MSSITWTVFVVLHFLLCTVTNIGAAPVEYVPTSSDLQLIINDDPFNAFDGTERRHISVIIHTDLSFLKEMFSRDELVAFSAINRYFKTVNRPFLDTHFILFDETNQEIHYHNFGYTLFAVKLGNPTFDKLPEILEVEQLRDILRSDEFHTDRLNFGLVLFLTSKQLKGLNDQTIDGFKEENGACRPDGNVIVVSFYGCTAKNVAPCLRTMAHEMAHALGADHDQTGDNVMRPPFQLKPKIPIKLTFSSETKESIAIGIYQIAQCSIITDGCLVEALPTKKVVKITRLQQLLPAGEEEQGPQANSKNRNLPYFLLSPFIFLDLFLFL